MGLTVSSKIKHENAMIALFTGHCLGDRLVHCGIRAKEIDPCAMPSASGKQHHILLCGFGVGVALSSVRADCSILGPLMSVTQ